MVLSKLRLTFQYQHVMVSAWQLAIPSCQFHDACLSQIYLQPLPSSAEHRVMKFVPVAKSCAVQSQSRVLSAVEQRPTIYLQAIMAGIHKSPEMERSGQHPETLHLVHTHTKIKACTNCPTHHYNNTSKPTQHYGEISQSTHQFKGDKLQIRQPYTTSTCITQSKKHL